jgi:hypothetical protein
MKLSLITRFFLPDFTCPDRISPVITDQVPATPRPTHPLLRRFWGIVHRYLRRFSDHYCSWVGVAYNNQIAELPFGLILKWSDGTRLEEVLTMQVARRAGFPVPRVICYGEHPGCPHAPVSILMTRVPGDELGRVYKTLSETDRNSILQQLKGYLEAMRRWESPWGRNRIYSLIGTAVRSVRIPNHRAGPFETEQGFNEYLLKPAWAGGFQSEPSIRRRLLVQRKWRRCLTALFLRTAT